MGQNLCINPVNFRAKEHYLSTKSQKNLESLLTKMNSDIGFINAGSCFGAFVPDCVSLKHKNAHFLDKRNYVTPVKPEFQLENESLLIIGKTELKFDNKSGKINATNKSFFIPWILLQHKIDKILTSFSENYNNTKIVSKHFKKIIGSFVNGD